MFRWKRAAEGVGAIAPVAAPSDHQGLGCIKRSPLRFTRMQVPNGNSQSLNRATIQINLLSH